MVSSLIETWSYLKAHLILNSWHPTAPTWPSLPDNASARITTATGLKHSVGSPAAMPAAAKGSAINTITSVMAHANNKTIIQSESLFLPCLAIVASSSTSDSDMPVPGSGTTAGNGGTAPPSAPASPVRRARFRYTRKPTCCCIAAQRRYVPETAEEQAWPLERLMVSAEGLLFALVFADRRYVWVSHHRNGPYWVGTRSVVSLPHFVH
jgi:hypothetical protein